MALGGAVGAAMVGWSDHVVIPMSEECAIVTDGDFSRDEYAVASMYGGLKAKTANGPRLVARDGNVYLSADRTFLHVAAQWAVEGSETDGGFVTLAKSDGGNVWADDCVEIFVGSAGVETNCYQILLNSANVRYETCRRNGTSVKGWISGAQTAAKIAKGFWTMETAIPWKALSGVDPKDFRFNLARNFVSSGLGYASLTGQADVYDPVRMLHVSSVPGFKGVKVHGLDTTLIAGRYRLTCEADDVTSFTSTCHRRHDALFKNDPSREQSIPMDPMYKWVNAYVSVKGFGKVYARDFLPFEGGGHVAGGPVTDKRYVEGLGFSHTRRYSSAAKVSVVAEGLPGDVKSVAELKSPDGHIYTAEFSPLPDRTQKAMIRIPTESARAAGIWEGAYVVDGRRYENAFGFEEKKFPWTGNGIGVSDRILEPFTPIELTERTLKTVLRDHTLSGSGLLDQVKSLGENIFAKPLALELKANGHVHEMKADGWVVRESRPNRVITEATGTFGPFRFTTTTTWDYDGFADVRVRLAPSAADCMVEGLTLRASLKEEHATLFHAMIDMTRGNPAGLIPMGDGVVWDSSKLIRKKNPKGLPWVPGEFCPYLWLGAEERGLALLFDSPKGYDLEDGKPMLRLRRGVAGSVTVEADVISRAHAVTAPMEFGFAFEVTPVKPRMPGWKDWTFMWGQKLPGMVNIDPCYNARAMGFFPKGGGFAHQPDDTNKWAYARATRKMLRSRHVDLDTMARLATTDKQALIDWGKRRTDHFKRNYWGSAERFARVSMEYLEADLVWKAMTLDKVAVYNCPSIIDVDDPAYRYNKAEWDTLVPWGPDPERAKRIFLTPGAVDYLLWCYREELRQGADGINFDEQYVIPQSNPDLSEVRDYKGRCIPEMGIVAARRMYWRLANLMDEMGHRERLIVVHATNTMIIPAFAFATICTVWEYDLTDVFQTQFPGDYCRAHSTGLQAGLVSTPLVLNKDPRRKQMGEKLFHERRQHLFRTALAITLQHGMWQHKMYWGDDSQAMEARYVFWMYGTHLDDCEFIPYWTKGKPFSVSGRFLVGAYKRGQTALFIVSNDGQKDKTRLAIDREAMGIPSDSVMMDVYTGESVQDGVVEIPDYEFKVLYVGPSEFGKRLKPVPADRRFIIR